MNPFPIFKVNHVTDKNKIKKICVFFENKQEKENINLTSLFKQNPKDEIFANMKIFTKKEIDKIVQEKIHVEFINQNIHMDDTIGSIKIKIVQAFNKTFSLDEIYLYGLFENTINSINIYQILTQNEKLPLTKTRIQQFLYNIRKEEVNYELPKKDIFTFEDILNLQLEDKNIIVAKVLGEKIFLSLEEYPFIADPYFVEAYDTVLEKSRKEVSTLNNNLLLSSGEIIDNNIYLCLAQEVFEFNEKRDFSNEYCSKIYFPFLYKKSVTTLDQLEEKKRSLLDETLKKIDFNVEKTFSNVDMFYQVYKYKEPTNTFNENIKKTGINNLHIVLTQMMNVKIPIENIFKLLSSSLDYPLIQYNPSIRQENIYRLYCNSISTDGRKIPFLSKAVIFKLMKSIGKSKSVSVYSNVTFDNETYNIVCEFDENARIKIYSLNNFDKIIPFSQSNNKFEKIDNIISLTVNPLINKLIPFFKQNGYDVELFKTIKNENVEIINLNYQTEYFIKNPIKINDLKGCISSIFSIELNDILKRGIILRYKRVSNYNKMDSIEAFVIEQYKQNPTMNSSDIVEELVNNFEDLNQEKAIDIIAKLIDQLQITRGTNRRKAIEIKINPGFKTTLILDQTTSTILIEMNGINDIYYLDVIPIYLDSFIRLTQNKKSTKFPLKTINTLCSKNETTDIKFDEIVSSSELPITENEIPMIDNEGLIYSDEVGYNDLIQGENMDDLLDILGIVDEDEDEDESENNQISVGGSENSDSDSSKSISSEEYSLSTSSSSTSSKKSINKELKEKEKQEQEQEIKEKEEEQEIVVPNEKKNEKKEQDENKVKNIINMQLKKKTNWVQQRLEDRFPQLFVKSKDDKIDLYSRMCPSQSRRQPVILTQEEKDKIMEEHKNDIDPEADFIEYGNDMNNSSKKNYYMCPRFWCLLTDTMVTEQDILEGKCGPKVKNVEDAIIPKNANKVPKDKYVYEFYGKNDKPHYPGFHKEKMPNGLCIPCCYKTWETPAQQKRRSSCQEKLDKKRKTKKKEKEETNKKENEEVSSNDNEKEINSLEKEKEENEPNQINQTEEDEEEEEEDKEMVQYIKGPEKYPLKNFRWGFLPIAIQKFFKDININCEIENNQNIAKNKVCFLRMGVENNSKQSFIACIANILFYFEKIPSTKEPKINKFYPNAKTDVPTIKQMKEIISNSITLDSFITYQNGNLTTIFSNDKIKVNIENYKDTKLYKKLQNDSNNLVIKNAQSFENFKLFLKDDTILIDYTYLWDIICMPNKNLFENGINMVILELPENDITNNVDFVCPSNYYSNKNYDPSKKTLFLVKRDNYFEPMYSYKNEEKRMLIIKTFSELDSKLSPVLKDFFKKILTPIIESKCKPFASMPNKYYFKSPPLLDDLLLTLKTKKYKILFQVVNFQNKVIGLVTTNTKNKKGYIPCYPSSIKNIPKPCVTTNKNKGSQICYVETVSFTDPSIWSSYQETLEFLTDYYKYKESNEKSGRCKDGKDLCKVVEDEVIVGFLTPTNQFVQIDSPVPISTINDNIKVVRNHNYLIADIETQVSTKVDTKRTELIKRIKLETNFYNTFRNTIRILLNDYMNTELKEKIKEECNQRYIIYDEQLTNVVDLLKKLSKKYLHFVIYDDKFDFKDLDYVSNCISLDKETCIDTKSVCVYSQNKDQDNTNICELILPKKNLITNEDNEILYYGKMADELIRYNRIKTFIFNPTDYISFEKINYVLNPDEMIILQSLLNQDFFENLIPSEINKYSKFNSYDTSEPIITQSYKNQFNLGEPIVLQKEVSCKQSEPQSIKSIIWKNCFPENYKEIIFDINNECALFMIQEVVKEVKKETYSIEQIKNDLIHEYNLITNNSNDYESLHKIVDILLEEGKHEVKQIKENKILLEELIIQDNFYATNFDLWLLLVKYKIPSIFISSKVIAETRYNMNEFVCYTDAKTDKYVFIVTPALGIHKIPHYKYIVDNTGKIEISVDELTNEECKRNITVAIENYIEISDYVELYKRGTNHGYQKKKPGLLKKTYELLIEEKNAPQEIQATKRKPIKKLKKTLEIVNDTEKDQQEQEQNPLEQFPEKEETKKRKTKKNKKVLIEVVPEKQKGTRKNKIELVMKKPNV